MDTAPDLVTVGHVTLDRTASGVRPGGAAYYAAVTAHRLGLSVGLLTSFAGDFPRAELPAGVRVANVPSRVTTIYELEEGAAGRQLRLVARAADLESRHLPAPWGAAVLTLLCPVANEVDPGLAASFPDASLGVAPQGWMRRRGAGGAITPQPWEDAGAVLPHAQVLAVSEEDVAPFGDAALEWFQRVPIAALTRGSRGATLFVNGEPYHVAADVAAAEASAVGAGDVFATALLIEYQRRADPWEAAEAAACAAAASVEGSGAAAVPDRAELERRLAAYRRRRGG